MLFEANSYGLPFAELLDFTFGEVRDYIEYHRELERKRLQDLSTVAYYQARMIGAVLAGECGEVFEHFPFWTEDEILEIRAQQAINYFSKF